MRHCLPLSHWPRRSACCSIPFWPLSPSAHVVGPGPAAAILDLVASVASGLDRPAVGAYSVRIFDFLLRAMDLRRQAPLHFEARGAVSMVERTTLRAVVALSVKLSETSFRPLFVRMLEWAQSEFAESGPSVDRNIAFYGLVSALADRLRSGGLTSCSAMARAKHREQSTVVNVFFMDRSL